MLFCRIIEFELSYAIFGSTSSIYYKVFVKLMSFGEIGIINCFEVNSWYQGRETSLATRSYNYQPKSHYPSFLSHDQHAKLFLFFKI